MTVYKLIILMVSHIYSELLPSVLNVVVRYNMEKVIVVVVVVVVVLLGVVVVAVVVGSSSNSNSRSSNYS